MVETKKKVPWMCVWFVFEGGVGRWRQRRPNRAYVSIAHQSLCPCSCPRLSTIVTSLFPPFYCDTFPCFLILLSHYPLKSCPRISRQIHHSTASVTPFSFHPWKTLQAQADGDLPSVLVTRVKLRISQRVSPYSDRSTTHFAPILPLTHGRCDQPTSSLPSSSIRQEIILPLETRVVV